ncbi:MAG TPA: putative N-acetylmannosamine-6-phosphate 2-epimerase [Candidatus Baltobacteraceae bacterium]|jgi:N-acylglucosamine-6-phosphate 2-epimerase|nr:putative N-acetylmannosamine-6-phosphate 2-epimerase [Candidatus Baltobacteraceae bacterium]
MISALLASLDGGLIVSCQAESESPLNAPEVIAVLARCAERNGSVAVRIEGEARVRAVRKAVTLPIVGIVKHPTRGDDRPYITTTLEDVAGITAAGARIVAYDATERPREGATTVTIVAAIHAAGAAVMADCATLTDGHRAVADGADLLATTLSGYTAATRGRALPDLDLLTSLAAIHPFVICEGGVGSPHEVRRAFESGARAVVVGTAITNVDVHVRRFVAEARSRLRD